MNREILTNPREIRGNFSIKKNEFEQIYQLIEGLYAHTTEQFSKLNSRIDNIESQIVKINGTLDDMNAKINQNTESIEQIKRDVKKYGKAISRHDLDIALVKKAIMATS